MLGVANNFNVRFIVRSSRHTLAPENILGRFKTIIRFCQRFAQKNFKKHAKFCTFYAQLLNLPLLNKLHIECPAA
jgi:hypothetical protein